MLPLERGLCLGCPVSMVEESASDWTLTVLLDGGCLLHRLFGEGIEIHGELLF